MHVTQGQLRHYSRFNCIKRNFIFWLKANEEFLKIIQGWFRFSHCLHDDTVRCLSTIPASVLEGEEIFHSQWYSQAFCKNINFESLVKSSFLEGQDFWVILWLCQLFSCFACDCFLSYLTLYNKTLVKTKQYFPS